MRALVGGLDPQRGLASANAAGSQAKPSHGPCGGEGRGALPGISCLFGQDLGQELSEELWGDFPRPLLSLRQ